MLLKLHSEMRGDINKQMLQTAHINLRYDWFCMFFIIVKWIFFNIFLGKYKYVLLKRI